MKNKFREHTQRTVYERKFMMSELFTEKFKKGHDKTDLPDTKLNRSDRCNEEVDMNETTVKNSTEIIKKEKTV